MKVSAATFLFLIFSLTSSGQNMFTDPRDGNVYRSAEILGKTWMCENLRYTGLPGTNFFDDDRNNMQAYGALYDWQTANKACPEGWRLPSGAEFRNLVDHFGYDDSWGRGPSESFNIQLGGQQDYQGIFSEVDEGGYYWTSTEYDADNAEYFSYLLIINKKVIDVSRKDDMADVPGSEKSNRYSVRCVKNN
ncbi:MAG TPA: FISUMP domain-containing protein [Bacteroidales bacterium]|nr:FISUMP domain-containing protein [Bacteroidales bacterium]